MYKSFEKKSNNIDLLNFELQKTRIIFEAAGVYVCNCEHKGNCVGVFGLPKSICVHLKML